MVGALAAMLPGHGESGRWGIETQTGGSQYLAGLLNMRQLIKISPLTAFFKRF
jgi:hypothetical protein